MYYMEVFEKQVLCDVECRDGETGVLGYSQTVRMRHPEQAQRWVKFIICHGHFTEAEYLTYANTPGKRVFQSATKDTQILMCEPRLDFLIDAAYIRDGVEWEGLFQITGRQYHCFELAFRALTQDQRQNAVHFLSALDVPDPGEQPPRFLQMSIHQLQGECELVEEADDN